MSLEPWHSIEKKEPRDLVELQSGRQNLGDINLQVHQQQTPSPKRPVQNKWWDFHPDGIFTLNSKDPYLSAILCALYVLGFTAGIVCICIGCVKSAFILVDTLKPAAIFCCPVHCKTTSTPVFLQVSGSQFTKPVCKLRPECQVKQDRNWIHQISISLQLHISRIGVLPFRLRSAARLHLRARGCLQYLNRRVGVCSIGSCHDLDLHMQMC